MPYNTNININIDWSISPTWLQFYIILHYTHTYLHTHTYIYLYWINCIMNSSAWDVSWMASVIWRQQQIFMSKINMFCSEDDSPSGLFIRHFVVIIVALIVVVVLYFRFVAMLRIHWVILIILISCIRTVWHSWKPIVFNQCQTNFIDTKWLSNTYTHSERERAGETLY